MMELHELQKGFLAAILSGDDTAIAGEIAAPERMEIYRNNVFSACAKALVLTYPCIEKLVGERFFAQAANAFTRAHPPSGGNLDAFGQAFAEFLEGLEPAKIVPYLPDMARLEWLMHEAAGAGTGTSIDISALAVIPPEKYFSVKLHIHPAVRLMRSRWPLGAIHAFCLEDAPAPDLASEQGVRVMVVRPFRQVELVMLPPSDFAFVQAVASGATMEEAYNEAAREDEAFDLAACIHVLLGVGALGGFSLPV